MDKWEDAEIYDEVPDECGCLLIRYREYIEGSPEMFDPPYIP